MPLNPGDFYNREKEHTQKIWEALNAFKAEYNALDISLLSKEFCDILNLQKCSFINGKESNKLFNNEEEWYLFASDITKCIDDEKHIKSFAEKYLRPEFKIKLSSVINTYELQWWLDSGAYGESFFELPSSVLVIDANSYWAFGLFSRSGRDFGRQDYNKEFQGLIKLILDI